MPVYDCQFCDSAGHVKLTSAMNAADDAAARNSADLMFVTILDYDVIKVQRAGELIHIARRLGENGSQSG